MLLYKKTISLFLLLFVFPLINLFPISKTDSLLKIAAGAGIKKQAEVYNEISREFMPAEPLLAIEWAKKALELAEKNNNQEQICVAFINLGESNLLAGRNDAAIEYLEKAQFLAGSIRNNSLLANALNSTGTLYTRMGDNRLALEFYNRALELRKKEGKTPEIIKSLTGIAQSHRNIGSYQQALEILFQANELSKKTRDKNEKAAILNLIGGVYWNMSNYQSALDYYNQSLELRIETNNKPDIASLYHNISIVYRDLGNLEKAIEYNDKSLSIREELNDKREIANSLNNKGSIYLRFRNYDKAVEFYQSALELRQATEYKEDIAASLNNLATVYRETGQFDKAIEYYLQTLNIRKETGNKQFIAITLNNIGGVYWSINNYVKALEYYLDALKIREETGNKPEIANSYNNIGIVYRDLEIYNSAIEYFNKSLELKKETGDKRDIAATLNVIGNTYRDMKEYDRALDNYRQSLILRIETGNQPEIAASHNNIGNTLADRLEFGEAHQSFRKAIEIFEKTNDKRGIASSFNNIGNAYVKQKDMQNALQNFLRAAETSRAAGDIFMLSLCQRKIGEIYTGKRQFDAAAKSLDESLQNGLSINNNELIKNAYYAFYELSKASGNITAALDYYRRYTAAKDAAMAEINSRAIMQLQMNFVMSKKEDELREMETRVTVLEKEKQIRDLNLKRQRIQRNLLFVIALLVLAFAIYFYRNYMVRKKLNLVLNEKIKIIEQAYDQLRESEKNLKLLNATKDKFFSIIAHDLKNPFHALLELSRLLKENIRELSAEESTEYTDLIHASASQLLELVENLLQWSRTQTGRTPFNPSAFSMYDLANENISLMNLNAGEKQISLVNHIPKGTSVFADKDMISTVLRNLISNAIKFTHTGGVVSIMAQNTGKEFIEIHVSDNGIGIEPENIEKLFNIEVHHSTSGTGNESGTGLGLILCKEFIEKNNGKISVKSEIGMGSTFIFTLPLNHEL